MKIRGLTHKMKNRIREHGDDWDVLQEKQGEYLIVPWSHSHRYDPYMVWVTPGKDIQIVDEYKMKLP